MGDAVVLDTSAVSISLKASTVRAVRAEALQAALAGKVAFISFVTVAELLFWAEKRHWSDKRRADLDRHIRAYGVLDPTRTTAELWAETKAYRESLGTPMQPHDLWIASAALEYDLPLVTADGDFEAIPDLTVLPL